MLPQPQTLVSQASPPQPDNQHYKQLSSDAAAISVQTINNRQYRFTEVWIYIIEDLTEELVFNWIFAAGGVHLTLTHVLVTGVSGFVDIFWGLSRQSVCLSRTWSRASDATALAWTDVARESDHVCCVAGQVNVPKLVVSKQLYSYTLVLQFLLRQWRERRLYLERRWIAGWTASSRSIIFFLVVLCLVHELVVVIPPWWDLLFIRMTTKSVT